MNIQELKERIEKAERKIENLYEDLGELRNRANKLNEEYNEVIETVNYIEKVLHNIENLPYNKPRLRVELAETWSGYIDYYSGHGHAFCSPNLVACLPISFSITYRETFKEILEQLRESLGLADYTPINERLFKEYEDEIRNIPTETFINVFKEAYWELKESDRFFNVDEEQCLDEDEDIEYPQFLAYFHIYLEKD